MGGAIGAANELIRGDDPMADDDKTVDTASTALGGGFHGKVFKDSINLYDDQARLVFEFLRKAAAKIITEEDRLGGEIKKRDTEKAAVVAEIASLKIKFLISAIAGGAALVGTFASVFCLILALGGAVCAVAFKLKEKKCVQTLAQVDLVLANLRSDFAAIRRDYRVHKLGVAYVPIASEIPFDNKTFLLDHTDTVPDKEFSLFLMKDQKGFVDNIQAIEAGLKNVPVMEESTQRESVQTGHMSRSMQQVTYYDYVGGLDRNLRSASYFLNDVNKMSVSLPIIPPDDDQARLIEDYCTTDIGTAPAVQVFDITRHEASLAQFHALNELRKSLESETQQFEKFLEDFIGRIAAQVQLIARAKISSSGKIVHQSHRMLTLSFKASFNHYSISKEDDEIKRLQLERFDFQESVETYKPFSLKPSSRVLYDPVSENWVAEDGSRTSFPLGIHQIQEEIIVPMVQNLLKETRLERLKIYNDIKNQKLDYLNQWHRDTDDFYGRGRAESSNIINLMQTALTEFNTAISQYKAFEDTEKSMSASAGSSDFNVGVVKESPSALAFSLAYCKEQTDQIRKEQDEFNNYVERLKEDIDRRAGDFGYIQYFDGTLRDGNAKDQVVSLMNTDKLETRRKSLVGVSAYVAGKADLPPAPVLEDTAYEQLSLNLETLAQNTLEGLRQSEEGAPSDIPATPPPRTR